MARQDRIAQLFSLLEEAEQNNDSDKITEIKSDLFKEFGISKSMGGMMSMDEMTRPLSFQVGGPVGMTERERMTSSAIQGGADKEMVMKAFNLAKANNPDGRISDQDFNMSLRMLQTTGASSPEETAKRMAMIKESMTDTAGARFTEADLNSVAVKLAQEQGNTSEENINLIRSQLEMLVPMVNKKIEDDTMPLKGIAKDVTETIKKIPEQIEGILQNLKLSKKSD